MQKIFFNSKIVACSSSLLKLAYIYICIYPRGKKRVVCNGDELLNWIELNRIGWQISF